MELKSSEEFCLLNYHNQTFLFANKNDAFIKTLPDASSLFGFSTKTISHTHVLFFEKLVQAMGCSVMFIDIGAYVGTISLLLANYLSKQNINCVDFYLFEPNIKNFDCLLKSIKFNNIVNINLFPQAISNISGKNYFYIRDNNYVSGRLAHIRTDYTVNVTTIDEQIKNIDRNIIIKIDTENNEINVIKGMLNLLNSNNCILILELRKDIIYQKFIDNCIFFDYLNHKYNLYITENIGYPKVFNKIYTDLDVAKYCTRNGIADMVCVDKRLTNCNFEQLFL